MRSLACLWFRDAGRAEAMIANPRFDTGRFRPPANDAVSVLLEEGIGCQLTGFAARRTEEVTVDIIANPSRVDVVVRTLIEAMMARTSCSFPPFLGHSSVCKKLYVKGAIAWVEWRL